MCSLNRTKMAEIFSGDFSHSSVPFGVNCLESQKETRNEPLAGVLPALAGGSRLNNRQKGHPMSASSSERDPVEELADEFLEYFRRGEQPALTEYTQRYPQWAERIRKVFPALA